MRAALSWSLILALTLPAPALAQSAKTPQNAQPTQNTSTSTTPRLDPPLTGELPPVGDPPPPSLTEPTPPPPIPPPLRLHKKRAWMTPVVAALEVGALGFAIAAVVVVSIGNKDDTWRYPLGGGLGGGFIACAGVGVIIGLVVR